MFGWSKTALRWLTRKCPFTYSPMHLGYVHISTCTSNPMQQFFTRQSSLAALRPLMRKRLFYVALTTRLILRARCSLYRYCYILSASGASWGALAKKKKCEDWLLPFVTAVTPGLGPRGITRLPLSGFSRNVTPGVSTKTCRWNSGLVEAWRK